MTDITPPGEHPEDTFTHRYVPALGRSVHRLGLACKMGMGRRELREALDMGPEYIFWTPRMIEDAAVIKEAIAANGREKYIITCGPTLGFFPGGLQKAVDKARKMLGTDYVDVLQLFWLGKTSAWREGVVRELLRLRETDAVRLIGASIHDRPRAGAMARDSELDLFMIRYNAAHPGAEVDIFPNLHYRRPAVVAYTATAWGKLLQAPSGWEGDIPAAGDCYRFALSDPHIDVVLNGPENLTQLKENLDALARGPMEGDEMARMRSFGKKARDTKAMLRFGFGA